MPPTEQQQLNKSLSFRKIEINRMQELLNAAILAVNDPNARDIFQIRYEIIDIIYESFFEHHNKIIGFIGADDNEFEAQERERKSFEGNYYTIKGTYSSLFAASTAADTTGNSNCNFTLPKLQLPTFSGEYTSFQSFIDMFDAVISKNDKISDIEKFNYLLSSLKGPALALVQNLPMTSSNFKIAYDTLIKRYRNVRLIASAHWQAIENTSKLSSDDPVALRNLLDVFEDNLAALKNLNLNVDGWDFILVQMLLKKLDISVATRFELHHNSTNIPKYADLIKFLSNHCTAMSNINIPHKHKLKILKSNNYVSKQITSLHTQTNVINCIACSKSHQLYKCPVFLAQTANERYQFTKSNKLCINCLSHSHRFNQCQSKTKCHKCNQAHHTLLHFEKAASSTSQGNDGPNPDQTSSTGTSSGPNLPVFSLFSSASATVLLSTALVEVRDKHGCYQVLRCLLDSGSMSSFITKSSFACLGHSKSKFSINLSGLGAMSSSVSEGSVTLQIRPLDTPHRSLLVDAIILPKICDNLPSVSFSTTNWSHISNIPLADPSFNRSGKIDLLLGADVLSQVVIGDCIRGSNGTPDAWKTIFGYILLGKISPIQPEKTTSLFCAIQNSHSLDHSLERFWNIEEIPDGPFVNPEDELCEKIFSDLHTRDPHGRYIVPLPFKDDVHPEFPDIRDLALQRLYSLERRLSRQPALHHQYQEFLKEYLDLNHMELVEPCDSLRTYYIPHHCICKPDSLTTKLRVVFNASAKLPNQKSLNDYLLSGPKLQRDLLAIILRFRLQSVVVCADIKMMFRQISVLPEHLDYLRILWRLSPNDAVREFRLKTVTYGLSCAPYLAIRVLEQLVKDEGEKFPLASQALLEDTYMDDITTSCASIVEARSLQAELIELLGKAGFQLRKWSSNEPSLLSDFPQEHLSISPLSFDSDEENPLKILGLQWSPTQDCLKFSVSVLPLPCTKRNLLSSLAHIFDPIGFLTPITFTLKHLIQQIWSLKLDWDQTPTPNIIRVWETYKKELPLLTNFHLPRRLDCDVYTACDIHCFGDSSEKGYCAALYFRLVTTEGNVVIRLVCAKAKVAPLKRISLPRLELCAAVLVARLIEFTKKVFNQRITFNNIYCWTDSMVVLSWISSSPSRWKTFVANRVAFIQDRTSVENWLHVPSALNPADIGSRGLSPANVLTCSLWWGGPEFLRTERKNWPHESIPVTDIVEEESKIALLTQVSTEESFLTSILSYHSGLSNSLRLVAWVLRFIYNSRNPLRKINGHLTSRELKESLMVFVKHAQSMEFSDEINALQSNIQVSKSLRKLTPFLDQYGILRVGGRLANAPLTFDRKFPALLPSHGRLTELIIEHFHKKYLHAGIQTVQCLISQHFWIVSAKRIIRRILSKCLPCWRTNPASLQPRMGNLPISRVTACRAFLHVGTDYCGPFKITMSKTRGAKTLKAYLCIFICFATKAVHFELTSDLSTEAFLAALRRFIARRGRCQCLYSDCGTNYVSANKQLQTLMRSAAAKEAIQWKFNPPAAPHFGGLWESAVKAAKTHLYRVIGEQVLSYEELNTVFIQIESVINSRPLIPVSNDPHDLEVLTPGHFLILEPLTNVPDVDMRSIPTNRLTRWQLLRQLHQHFWHRWSTEYLHTLHQRCKWTQESSSITPGTLVLLKTDNIPPLQWPRGRIVEVFPGKDGRVRVVKVRTASGVLQRPVVKVCPLPLNEDKT